VQEKGERKCKVHDVVELDGYVLEELRSGGF
jgi:hypothetical protein